MKFITKSIKILSILFLGIGLHSCEEDDVILPEVIAEFTYTINQETGVVSFLNTSENANVYMWDFGDTQSSTEVNPSHLYQPGTYTVVLSAKNVASPYVTFTSTITIEGGVDPDPDPDPDCDEELAENIDPANGDLNWTFMTNDVDHTFEAFGNIAGEIVDNPVLDDVNSSCSVEQVTKTSGCETWSGLGKELATALDFTDPATNKVFTMKVLAETEANEVTLRLERLPFPDTDPAVDRVATITQVGAWEELTFDFSDVDTGTYKSMIIYFERDAACDDDIYYFDDVAQVAGSGGGGGGGGGTFDGGLVINGDFETGVAAPDWTGNAANVVDQGGNFVNEAMIAAAGNPWDVNLSQALALEENKTYEFSFEAFTDDTTGSRTMIAGIGEAGDNFDAVTETPVLTSTPQTFTYTMTVNYNDFANSRVLFDMGAETGYVFIDNVSLVCTDCDSGGSGGGGSSGEYDLSLPIDFESDGFGGNWTWNVFENDTNPPLEFVANPSASGINTSSTVAKITALQAGQPWVGTETAHGEMGITWDLSASNAIIKIMVYKTVISDVGIKLVNPTGGAQEEIKVANTVVNQWEELTFDFTGRIGNGLDGSTNIDQIVVFPDFNLDGRTSDNVVYFDNITFQ